MFHSNNPTLFGRPGRAVAGAVALRSTIVGLRRVSRCLTGGTPHDVGSTPNRVREIRELLSAFAAELGEYFDSEEMDGYYEAIGEGHTGLGGKVDALERRHDMLRDAVASVRRFARDGGEALELGHLIGRIVDEFEHQEHEENGLLQEFFLRDEGGRG